MVKYSPIETLKGMEEYTINMVNHAQTCIEVHDSETAVCVQNLCVLLLHFFRLDGS